MCEFVLIFLLAIVFVVNDLEYVFVNNIEDVAIRRTLMATKNFLMRSEGKMWSLAREWFMKRRKCEKNIWRSHQFGFLRQLRDSWICMRSTMICWKTCKIVMRRLCRTGDRTIDSILLSDCVTNFILICYISLFESRHELRAWCVTRVKQLKDPIYLDEQDQ
jgi:hypothetical protein